jgi:C4-dicarboxylate-specific signal transduction histidine kinase
MRHLVDAHDTGAILLGLAQIESNALRAGEIVHRMRDVAERRELRKERIDFDELIREVVEFSTFGYEDVSFESGGQAVGIVLADHLQIAQVLTSLIRNACEAMAHSDPKIITISLVEDAEQVTVCVSDTGPGIPPDLRLFEATASGKEHGMGIGLSICRTIIDSSGGRIWAEQPAQGARFCFSLPRAELL